MRKLTAVIGALFSLLPLGQALVTGTGVTLTTAAVMIFIPETAKAESVRFYEKKADTKFNEEDYYGAIADYLKAIEVNPKFEDTYYSFARIGRSQYYLKDYKSAIKNFTKSIQSRPGYAYAYSLRADTKADMGDNYGAISDYNRAIEIDPNDPYAYIFSGYAKQNLGDLDSACADWYIARRKDTKMIFKMDSLLSEFCTNE